MRDLINLFEAKRPAKWVASPTGSAAKPLPSETVLKAVLAVARKLGQSPLFLRPDRQWADQVVEALNAKKAQHLSDPENGPFDVTEELHDIVDRVWHRVNHVFIGVRRDVEHEETAPGGYTSRARERHGIDPDSHDMGGDVESSQWLTAMSKQADVGNLLSVMTSLTDSHRVMEALRQIDSMAEYFADPITDGGEEPTLVEDMHLGLPRLLALLVLIYGRAPS